MQALFIGQAYIDVTFLTDQLPTGDEKTIARDYAISFGGNAVTAAFCCAKLGGKPELLCSQADDWLARMFLDMAAAYGISIHGRKVRESSLSFIMPKGGKRAIVRCRDNEFLHPFPPLTLTGMKALHLDGHMPDAALHYATTCKNLGILTSLDGGAVRENTDELLNQIDIAVVSERFCQQLGMSTGETLAYLRTKNCPVGAVTLGDEGMVWYEAGGPDKVMPALNVPLSKVVDSNGAGDVFHGAYVASYLQWPERSWDQHFRFARGASTHAIQHLGNEASLPTLEDIERANSTFLEKAAA
ncbi:MULTISPECIES: sugar kinase [Stappiaceae]|jgi:sugar/nucleoside kinase (ribokinase family)|uniref:Ribokinase n=2 Tax=Roseibium TaxID=150830 RepID=A0A0M6XWF9_9HYPH|nr:MULTISPECIES: sugar kinase [Stappiaceae]MCR9282400.1 sugar kinase [Paracoccaceae bacterium]MEC9402269.1 sugar kinase [Pseudomonadota bacterium]AMN53827.1 sugar kinase [Labrenzia sp. CP4]AQQ02229.1 ribokinase [Roseibium aggregatum]ERP85760.1 sugar kinase [Labrenzia sp. C1B10]